MDDKTKQNNKTCEREIKSFLKHSFLNGSRLVGGVRRQFNSHSFWIFRIFSPENLDIVFYFYFFSDRAGKMCVPEGISI